MCPLASLGHRVFAEQTGHFTPLAAGHPQPQPQPVAAQFPISQGESLTINVNVSQFLYFTESPKRLSLDPGAGWVGRAGVTITGRREVTVSLEAAPEAAGLLLTLRVRVAEVWQDGGCGGAVMVFLLNNFPSLTTI